MRYRFIILSIILFVIIALFLIAPTIHPFLSITKPVKADILVIEGWLFDYMLDEAVDLYKKGKYEYIITTGGARNFSHNKIASGANSSAEYAAKRLVNRGIDPESIFTASGPAVKNHHTYNSAFALKKWMLNNMPEIKTLNIFTGGPHGRKTYNIFKKVLGENIKVGIISSKIKHYNSKYWWTSLRGSRVTFKFIVGYIYALVYPQSLLPEIFFEKQ